MNLWGVSNLRHYGFALTQSSRGFFDYKLHSSGRDVSIQTVKEKESHQRTTIVVAVGLDLIWISCRECASKALESFFFGKDLVQKVNFWL